MAAPFVPAGQFRLQFLVAFIAQLHRGQGGSELLGLRRAIEEHDLRRLLQRDRTLRGEVRDGVVHLLGAIALDVKGGTEVGSAGLGRDRLICRDDDPVSRVEHGRHVRGCIETLPVVAGIPAGARPAAISPQVVRLVGDAIPPVGRSLDGPHRVPARGLVADVTGGGGEQDVLRRSLHQGRRGRDLLGVRGTAERNERLAGPTGHQCGPLQGHREVLRCAGHRPELFVRREQPGDDGAMHRSAHLDLDVLATSDPDRLSTSLICQTPAVALIGILAHVLLNHQVADVTTKIGQSPGQVSIAPDHDSRHAGHGEPGNVEGAFPVHLLAVQTDLKPDRGIGDLKVGIVADDGFPRCGVLPRDHEGVRPDPRAVAQQMRHGLQRLLDALERPDGVAGTYRGRFTAGLG